MARTDPQNNSYLIAVATKKMVWAKLQNLIGNSSPGPHMPPWSFNREQDSAVLGAQKWVHRGMRRGLPGPRGTIHIKLFIQGNELFIYKGISYSYELFIQKQTGLWVHTKKFFYT